MEGVEGPGEGVVGPRDADVMDVVCHQAVGPDVEGVAPRVKPEPVEIAAEVGVLFEDNLLVIAALGDLVRIPEDDGAGESGHVANQTSDDMRRKRGHVPKGTCPKDRLPPMGARSAVSSEGLSEGGHTSLLCRGGSSKPRSAGAEIKLGGPGDKKGSAQGQALGFVPGRGRKRTRQANRELPFLRCRLVALYLTLPLQQLKVCLNFIKSGPRCQEKKWGQREFPGHLPCFLVLNLEPIGTIGVKKILFRDATLSI